MYYTTKLHLKQTNCNFDIHFYPNRTMSRFVYKCVIPFICSNINGMIRNFVLNILFPL